MRDFIETDIEKRVYWETAETEWQKWDAPWEYETLSDEEKKKALTAYKETMGGWVKKFSELPGEEKRTGFQIVVAATGEYIGWCGSYRIDGDCSISADGENARWGSIFPPSRRGERAMRLPR